MTDKYRTKIRMQAPKLKLFSSLSYTVPKGLHFTLFCNQLPPPQKKTKNKNKNPGKEFPGSLLVRIWQTVIAVAHGSIPGKGKETLQAAWYGGWVKSVSIFP